MFDKNKVLAHLEKFIKQQERMYPDMNPFVRRHLKGIAQAEYLLKLWRANPKTEKDCPPDVLKAIKWAKSVARLWRLHKKVLRERRKVVEGNGQKIKRGKARKSAHAPNVRAR